MNVLLAGATGLVGYEVLKLLHDRGDTVRTLSRDAGRATRLASLSTDVRIADATQPETLRGVCDDIDVVVSALGAPLTALRGDRRSFRDIDEQANIALIDEAMRAGARRFVYVGVHPSPAYDQTNYVLAHTQVERRLNDSPLEASVIRPTGLFGAFGDLLQLARLGFAPLIGDGSAETNPVHEADVAEAIADLVHAPGPIRLNMGGPEIMTRRQIVERAFEALGKSPRTVAVPTPIVRCGVAMLGLVNRRLGEFLRFVIRASTNHCVAPALGKQTLSTYFQTQAQPGVRHA